MRVPKVILISLCVICFTNAYVYAQYQTLDGLYTIHDPGFPESGLNSTQVGMNTGHIGDINGDGFDDWAIGLPAGADYATGLTAGTVHIYFGGEIPESESPSDLIIGGKQGQYGFGYAISAAGDVNNDGYDDLLVRYTAQISSEEIVPSVALFYGGSPLDEEPDLIFTAIEGHADYWFGTLSDAGDVNNDGFGDIIIGAPTPVTGADTGHVYLYYGGQSMDNIADVVFTGDFTPGGPPFGGARNFGLSISGAGDMNKDGFDDIVINASSGAKLYLGGAEMDNEVDVLFDDLTGFGTGPAVSGAGDVNNDGYDDVVLGARVAGQAYICFGGETVDGTSDLFIPGWADLDYFGRSVSGAGDVNGDGIDDIVIGCDYQYLSTVRVYFGGMPMDSLPDVAMFGELQGDRFGYTVSINGDLDNDGYSDLIIGGIGNYNTIGGNDDAGNVWLFNGGESMDNEPEAIFTGTSSREYFGQRAVHAGDVNNDGFPDVIVGQGSYYANYRYVGRAYLYFGSAVPDDTPDMIFMSKDLNAHYNFGGLVHNAGDVNNDGYSDLIIAETNYNISNRDVYLYYGAEEMDSIPDLRFHIDINSYPQAIAALGDVNNDGYDDFLFTVKEANLYLGGETMDNIADATFDSTSYCGAGAGDLNGDGFFDFMMNSYNKEGTGYVKVFFGDTTIDNSPQLKLKGELNDYYSIGTSIAGGHDINNDGYDDVVVSSSLYDATPDGDEGRVYIYYGGESMDVRPDMTITGDKLGQFLGGKVMTLPDLNADGYDEVLISHGLHPDDYDGPAMYIYYGGAPMDSIPDIFLPHLSECDVSAYKHPTEDYVGIVVGDLNLSAVIVYTNSGLSGFSQDENIMYIPLEQMLYQNYPNPFNPSTAISYQLTAVKRVDLSIYNILGQKVATLVSERQGPGQYQINWNASGHPSGLYFYQIRTDDFIKTRRMLLLK